jgi:hypothetical protein
MGVITSNPKGGNVPGFAFAVPVVRGKEELDRKMLEEIAGPRLAEHEAATREAGISRHAAWHQQTPDGNLALAYKDAPDEAAIGKFTGSNAPFNTWFREVLNEVHGVDISQPGPPVTKVPTSSSKDQWRGPALETLHLCSQAIIEPSLVVIRIAWRNPSRAD